MKTFLIAALTFLGVSLFTPQAEARTYHRTARHYSGRHYSGHYSHSRVVYRDYHHRYYPRYYTSGYYPRVVNYGYYGGGYCYPRYYRPGVSLVFRF